jgi:pimeloyl-ACP methyl ester carboxylesterase
VAQLADSLGITKFSVSGHSGGGPYVAACAYALPERVISAAILSGAGPVDAQGATAGMSAVNKAGFKFGRYVPWVIWQAVVWLVYHRRRDDPAADMQRGNGIRPEADDLLLLQPEIKKTCLRSEVEAFRFGLRGFAWDARLLTRPLGFCLEDIVVPVDIWHGTADDLTTTAMARCEASKISKSRLFLFNGEAHLLLFPHWEEILSELTGR